MKRVTLLFLILIQMNDVVGQSLTVTGPTSVPTSDPCFDTEAHLTVKNVSNNTFDVVCAKNVITAPSGTDNYFCWGGNCFSSSTIISSSTTNIPGGQSSNEFQGHYSAYCDLGIAIVEYCFYPLGDSTDMSCITITYNDASASINGVDKLSTNYFYPNPSKGHTTFVYNKSLNTHLNIIDILGNQIKTIHLSDSGQQDIYVGDLSKGIYFGNIIEGNKLIGTRKLIVK